MGVLSVVGFGLGFLALGLILGLWFRFGLLGIVDLIVRCLSVRSDGKWSIVSYVKVVVLVWFVLAVTVFIVMSSLAR